MIDVNLIAAIRLTLALERALRRRLGRRQHGALGPRSGRFGQAEVWASKSGLVGFGRAFAQRWAPRVRVNAVAPSLVDTPMTQAMPPEVLAKLVARIPAGRIGTPDDVAGIVAFLASPTPPTSPARSSTPAAGAASLPEQGNRRYLVTNSRIYIKSVEHLATLMAMMSR